MLGNRLVYENRKRLEMLDKRHANTPQYDCQRSLRLQLCIPMELDKLGWYICQMRQHDLKCLVLPVVIWASLNPLR